MIKEKEILDILDHSRDNLYCTFIWLGNVYSYLVDSRLNVFRSENDEWAIVAERLGYDPRAGRVLLEISYYGNCLVNLQEYNNHKANYYHVIPINQESFNNASNNEEGLKEDAVNIMVRGEEVGLYHDKSVYGQSGINIKESEIRWEDAMRLLILKHGDLFRATDDELYKSIPRSLKKILVLDKWYHRDFIQTPQRQDLSDEQIKHLYELKKDVYEKLKIDFETFLLSNQQQQQRNREFNEEERLRNIPGSYETWRLLAKVISTGDVSFYKPSLKPNSHWSNFPGSGSL